MPLTGEERALDAGTGAGALAIALAPLVREVVGVDLVPELLAEGRKRAPANVELSRPTPPRFRSAWLLRPRLHGADPPPRAAARARGRRAEPGAQARRDDARRRPAGADDPLAAIELNRFEHARDPSTTRILADVDLRGLFDSNSLVLRRSRTREPRDLERYLELAGCQGDDRERANPSRRPTRAEIGWYVLAKPRLL